MLDFLHPGVEWVAVSESLFILLKTHEQIRANIDREEAAIVARLSVLQEEFHELQRTKQALERRRWALDETEKLYRDVNAAVSSEISPDAMLPAAATDLTADRKLRARVGPQRYLILAAVRDVGSMSIEEIVAIAGLTPKRVKDQVNADVPIGVLARDGEKISITDAGRDLMARFEDYKRSKGEPLPSRSAGSDDGDNHVARDEGEENDLTRDTLLN